MKRRIFNKGLTGLMLLPLVSCNYASNTTLTKSQIKAALQQQQFYGVDILELLALNDNQLSQVKGNLFESYPGLLNIKNETSLHEFINEKISEEFVNDSTVVFNRHEFSRLETMLYKNSKE